MSRQAEGWTMRGYLAENVRASASSEHLWRAISFIYFSPFGDVCSGSSLGAWPQLDSHVFN